MFRVVNIEGIQLIDSVQHLQYWKQQALNGEEIETERKVWTMNLECKNCYLTHCKGATLKLILSLFVLTFRLAFEVICISETYFDSNTLSDDNSLEIIPYFVQTTSF